MRDSTVKRWSRVHAALYRATGGVLGRRLAGNDMLLLTTLGRSSGHPHTVPLLFLSDNGRLVVIASYGGRDRHPDWYLNLVAYPVVEVRIASRAEPLVARTATAEERETWWPRIVDAYGDYALYQSRTERVIPVVFLEPAHRLP
ncbi:MAG TPA: nitroreductase family deazaflavin-dependent oxidoreductase [Acidimicrobiia bacterium]|nr:nitroreductase family deazaflavin-dependent oxidoreductase [Acidimicrobiia bacterium]